MQYSTFLDRKLARRFRCYDTDGDGYIEREDFEQAAIRMAEEFGLGPESPARQRLASLCIGLWEHLAKVADADGSGRISEQEYKTAFNKGLLETPESFDAGYKPFVDAVTAIADTDGDGRLNVDEHVRWTSSLMNLSPAQQREAFARLDRDGDGFLTTEEFLDAVREFYFNDDPSSNGSWLLGSLDPS